MPERRLPVGVDVPLASRPAWFRVALAAHDRLARVSLPLALRLADAAGRTASRLAHYGARRDEVAALFPDLPTARLEHIASQATADDLKNRVLERLILARGHRVTFPLLDAAAPSAMRRLLAEHRTAVIATVHSGPLLAVGSTLELIGARALVVRVEPGHPVTPPLEAVWVQGEPNRAAYALRRCLDRLRAGVPVVVAIDGRVGTSTLPVPCLGRAVRFRRGAFMLARATGAPIVPVLVRWQPDRLSIGLDVDSPLLPGGLQNADEHELAAAAGRWLNARLTAEPERLSLTLHEMLLASPPVA